MPATVTIIVSEPGVGKSTIGIQALDDINKNSPTKYDLLFVSSEMTDIDLNPFRERIPGLAEIEILFLGDYLGRRPDHILEYALNQGYDVVLMDSFEDIVQKCKPEAGVTKADLEVWLVELMIKNAKGRNAAKKNTAFLTVQHVTKEGQYKGSTGLKHNTTAMLELRRDKKSGQKYAFFSKNRRGLSDIRLNFDTTESGIEYDTIRFDREIDAMKKLAEDKKRLKQEQERFDKILAIGSDEEVEMLTLDLEDTESTEEIIQN